MKLTETQEGTIIEIFVKTNQPEFRITISSEEILVSSTKEPVKGRVNKEILKELAEIFHAKVELISGSTSRQKKLIIKGLRKSEVERLLHNCI